jgi:hypothetical protein
MWLWALADRPRSLAGRGAPEVSRFSCMLLLSVRGFSDYSGPTARSRLSRTVVVPSSIRRESASWFCVFQSSIARPTDTPYSDSGESISKGDIHSCCCARACGNVKNLSLLTGYTGGGRRPAVMNMCPCLRFERHLAMSPARLRDRPCPYLPLVASAAMKRRICSFNCASSSSAIVTTWGSSVLNSKFFTFLWSVES